MVGARARAAGLPRTRAVARAFHLRCRLDPSHGWMTLDRKSKRLNSSHTEIYHLSRHDALPIYGRRPSSGGGPAEDARGRPCFSPEMSTGSVARLDDLATVATATGLAPPTSRGSGP